MKIIVFGANGLLGQKLLLELSDDYSVHAAGQEQSLSLNSVDPPYTTVDITQSSKVSEYIRAIDPSVIINAAAYTDVDGCETNKELCWKVNAEGVKNIAAEAKLTDSKVIHISTDYLFDGENGPYSEEEIPNPQSYYGKAKHASENNLIGSHAPYAIIRTNVLYGHAFPAQASFVRWVRGSLSKNKEIRVVKDQYNNPTLANELAGFIRQVIENNFEGIINYAGADYLNRVEFAERIADKFKLPKNLILPITTEELNQLAPRPKMGGLKTDKARELLGTDIPGVDEGLNVMIREMDE